MSVHAVSRSEPSIEMSQLGHVSSAHSQSGSSEHTHSSDDSASFHSALDFEGHGPVVTPHISGPVAHGTPDIGSPLEPAVNPHTSSTGPLGVVQHGGELPHGHGPIVHPHTIEPSGSPVPSLIEPVQSHGSAPVAHGTPDIGSPLEPSVNPHASSTGPLGVVQHGGELPHGHGPIVHPHTIEPSGSPVPGLLEPVQSHGSAHSGEDLEAQSDQQSHSSPLTDIGDLLRKIATAAGSTAGAVGTGLGTLAPAGSQEAGIGHDIGVAGSSLGVLGSLGKLAVDYGKGELTSKNNWGDVASLLGNAANLGFNAYKVSQDVTGS